jgi:hypothetical protein
MLDIFNNDFLIKIAAPAVHHAYSAGPIAYNAYNTAPFAYGGAYGYGAPAVRYL